MAWCRLMVSAGLADELRALCGGYLARSGGGGYHLIFRTETPEKNTVLAGVDKGDDVMRYLDPSAPDGFRRSRVLIETRGVGGFAVVAGGDPTVHPTGVPYRRIVLPEYLTHARMRNWELYSGMGVVILDQARAAKVAERQLKRVVSPAPDHLYEASTELRETMFALARQLDQRTPTQVGTGSTPPRLPDHQGQGIAGARPGEAWAGVTTWDEILKPHGWRRDHSTDKSDHWTRPGKSSGTSATTNYNGSQLLYVYTSSTDFEPETSYTKFGAYAVLNHEGDFQAAAAELVDKGFADPMTAETDSREQRVAQMAIKAEDRLEANEIARRNRSVREFREPPEYGSLADQRDAEFPPPGYLVDELILDHGIAMVIAQAKAGKTTLISIDLVKALVEGSPWLGQYATKLEPDAAIAIWNMEVDAARFRGWQLEANIDREHEQRIFPRHLRGYPIDLLQPLQFEATVQWLRERTIKVWILDPLSKIYLGDTNNDTEFNQWWRALEAVIAEAGVEVCIIPHHAGHNANDDWTPRARGTSAMIGNPDVTLTYRHGGKYGDNPPDSKRYLSAYGRDVDVPEITLDRDPVTGVLHVDRGSKSREDDKRAKLGLQVARVVWTTTGDSTTFVSKSKVEKLAKGNTNEIRAVLDWCVEHSYLTVEVAAGPGKPTKIRRGPVKPPDL